MPVAQLTQAFESEAPDEIEAVPASHPRQLTEPETLEYDPEGQAEHKLADDAEY